MTKKKKIKIRYATKEEVKDAMEWALKKYKNVFKKLAEYERNERKNKNTGQQS